ncbi:MAG: AmmeMemoRadiSam system protein A [Calditrichaceae bacterium]|nr:AmmeMemoRadiSam system protein A [Calditrichaceae bacterium]MBN2710467.1 AmmeMemoRadiSam system protein A [Calditrichaceae bacterium]RQV93599.1 MAG: AmmeMemoRadiSam system protein A [Calditrichota bacterium]
MNFNLNEQEKKYLLELVRNTVLKFLQNREPEIEDYFSENLKTKTGVFVTLHISGDLRGCIGYVEGYKPLQDAVKDLAVSAAFNDPRFSPLSMNEFNKIDIEISVLTPLTEVKDISEIEIGRDGLMIKKPPYSGLLLPQVATEYGWDVETFLEHTCQKAGLPSSAWKDKETLIQKFSAIIFNENELGLL